MDANRSPGSSPPGGTAGGTDATRGGVKRRASAAPAMLELESALEVGADSLAGLVGAVSSFGVDGQADLFAKVYEHVALLSWGWLSPQGRSALCLFWRRALVYKVVMPTDMPWLARALGTPPANSALAAYAGCGAASPPHVLILTPFSFACLLRLCRASFPGGMGGSAILRNDFVKDLRQIDAVGATIPDTVPLDVLVAVDRGRNPEAVTKETLYVMVAVIVGCGDSVVQHMSCWWTGFLLALGAVGTTVWTIAHSFVLLLERVVVERSGCHGVFGIFRVLILTCLVTSVFLRVSVSTWY